MSSGHVALAAERDAIDLAGDEAQQDDNGHQQTPDSPELLVVHCFGG
jgi:hypothetical protein